jgi:hypothetical protein
VPAAAAAAAPPPPLPVGSSKPGRRTSAAAPRAAAVNSFSKRSLNSLKAPPGIVCVGQSSRQHPLLRRVL